MRTPSPREMNFFIMLQAVERISVEIMHDDELCSSVPGDAQLMFPVHFHPRTEERDQRN